MFCTFNKLEFAIHNMGWICVRKTGWIKNCYPYLLVLGPSLLPLVLVYLSVPQLPLVRKLLRRIVLRGGG